jgi:hypothetical protein
MHLELDYRCPDGGPPRGTLRAEDSEPHSFVGTLDLLRLLDELSRDDSPPPKSAEAAEQ